MEVSFPVFMIDLRHAAGTHGDFAASAGDRRGSVCAYVTLSVGLGSECVGSCRRSVVAPLKRR